MSGKRRITFRIVGTLVTLLIVGLMPQSAQGDAELWRNGSLVETFSRIQDAVDIVQPGDTIRIRAGIYYEVLDLGDISGTENDPIVLEGAAGEQVVIDGAHEPITQPGSGLWTAEPGIGPGVYSLDFAGHSYGTSDYIFASLADETALWTYAEMARFNEFFSGQGVFYDEPAGRLYIRLEGDQDPNTVGINVATDIAVLYMPNASHWIIRNLELRHGARAVIHPRYTVENVLFEDLAVVTARNGLLIWGDANNVVIRRSSFFLGWNDGWWWDNVKLIYPKTMEGTGVELSGQNIEVSDCEVSGFFNGIGLEGENIRIHHNTIHNIADDAFEPEGEAINVHFNNNLVYDVFVGISCAPIPAGPLYIYRNVLENRKIIPYHPDTQSYGSGIGFKLGGRIDEPTLNVKIYQNTLYCEDSCVGHWAYDELWREFEWYNNIFYSNDGAVISDSGLAAEGNVYNGNLYFRSSEGTLIRRWNSTDAGNFESLEAARLSAEGQAAGWEADGVEGDPEFWDTVSFVPDLRVQASSPAVNSGVSTPSTVGWEDTVEIVDGQPDMGAYELGVEVEIGARTGGSPGDPDGGTVPDGGSPTDAMSGGDGQPEPDQTDGRGCGCRLSASEQSGSFHMVLLLIVLCLGDRCRKGRRR